MKFAAALFAAGLSHVMHTKWAVAKQWERVPEGRVRALCFSADCSSRTEHGARKSPHPASGHLLPRCAQEKGNGGEASRISYAIVALFAVFAAAMPAAAQLVNDYPTSARADYVYGCMKVNGETREALEKCSCSIDIIASILPYDHYVSAETFMSMAQVVGERGVIFRQSEPARKATDELRRAEAEAEIRCF